MNEAWKHAPEFSRATKAPVLVAVSKGQPASAIAELYRLGQRDFGENYAQELAAKAEELVSLGCTDIRWHFIGHVQTNKLKVILPWVHCLHTLDSVRLAEALISKLGDRTLPTFIEVNIDREESKAGVLPDDLPAVLKAFQALPGFSARIQLLGLMAIPAPQIAISAPFQALRSLLGTYENVFTDGFLSMGMSDDFETAIREGSSHIRVGTALFGPRQLKA